MPTPIRPPDPLICRFISDMSAALADAGATLQTRQAALEAVYPWAVNVMATTDDDEHAEAENLALAQVSNPEGALGLRVDRSAEEIARKFHEATRRLAPSFGIPEGDSWETLSGQSQSLLVAVVTELKSRGVLS